MYRVRNLKVFMKWELMIGKTKLNELSETAQVFSEELANFRNLSKYMSRLYSNTQNQDILPDRYTHQQSLQSFKSLLKTMNFADISSEQTEQFLTRYRDIINTVSIKSKQELSYELCKTLLNYDKVNLSFLHSYINECTANNVKVNITEILANLKYKLPGETYKLLLKNCCEQSDTEEALKILDLMKLELVPLDEFVFNNLILAQAASGGLPAAELVLSTMRAAQLNISDDTKFSILKGLSRYSSQNHFQKAVKVYGFKLNNDQLIEIISELGLNNANSLLEIKNLYNESTLSKEFKYLLKQKLVNFVQTNKFDAVFSIFKHFSNIFEDDDNGFFILEEMISSNYDIETIKTFLKAVQDIKTNTYLLQNLTEVALRTEKADIAWALLAMFTSELRPHFFWPLLIQSSKCEGEVGVFKVVRRMKEMNVNLDFETWYFYVLPYCNLDECNFLIKRFQEIGITMKELLSPLLLVLVKNVRLALALDLCNHYNVKIFGEYFLNHLSNAWYSSRDSLCVVSILQKYCETNNSTKDFIGEFLLYTLKLCKETEDFELFYNLLKVINEKSLKILHMSSESLKRMLQTHPEVPPKLFDEIDEKLNAILDFGMNSDNTYIPHPKDMSLEELECHLIELTEKKMNTRGLLRKLILLHSNVGNVERVNELRKQFLEAQYEETIGMKSSIFHSFTKAGKTEAALEMYQEIKENYSNFILDDFKVIDLCVLLVKNGCLSEAWTIIKKEAVTRKKFGSKGIKRNCLKLLNAFKEEDQQTEMFNFLVNNRYCKPENVLLGPLVNIHLKNGNLEKACDTYINFAQKYKCTPMQVELLKEILNNQNQQLLGKVLEYTAQIHGNLATQTALIVAAAECGKTSPLAKILSQNTSSINDYLKQRCDRWILQGKSAPVMTLLLACFRIDKKFKDADYLIQGLIKTYRFNNDIEALIRLSNYLTDNEIDTSCVKMIQEIIEDIGQKSKKQNG